MIGKTVGQYRILAKLGEGGMGAVYRAEDRMLERQVAIKVLRPELARQKALVERFRTEAVALARLNHPNIATVHGLIQQGADYFMVLEYVEGETLESILHREGRLPWQRAVQVARDTLAALEHAHGAGVVHRDLKPANLMLTRTGMVKVMDFGIARMIGTSRHTEFGRVVGTPLYMSPEQLRGEDVDGRSDVYSLAVVLFELLTGREAFEADSDYALLMAQLSQMPAPPSRFVAGIPVSLDQALARALNKERGTRWASAREFRRALGTIVPEPLTHSPEERVERAPDKPAGPAPATRVAEAETAERPAAPAQAERPADDDPPPVAGPTRVAEPDGTAGPTRVAEPEVGPTRVAGVGASAPETRVAGGEPSRDDWRARVPANLRIPALAGATVLVVGLAWAAASRGSASADEPSPDTVAMSSGSDTGSSSAPTSPRELPSSPAPGPDVLAVVQPPPAPTPTPRAADPEKPYGVLVPPSPPAGPKKSEPPKRSPAPSPSPAPAPAPPPEPPPPPPPPLPPPPEESNSGAPTPSAADFGRGLSTLDQWLRDRATDQVGKSYAVRSADDASNRDAIVALLGKFSPQLEEPAVTDVGPEPGGRATVQYTASLRWRSSFGNTRRVDVRIWALYRWQNGAWAFSSWRFLGTPDLN